MGNLQKEMTNLVGCKSSVPVQAIPVGDKKQELMVQATSEVSKAIGQSDVALILTCKHWIDFQILATHSHTLTFNIKETERIFQVDACRGSQIIRLPVFFQTFQ